MKDVVVLEIPNVFAEFSSQFLECSVCWNDDVWFLYLVLKLFFVSPMYVSEVLLSVRVTITWQMVEVWRLQLPLSGDACFCWHLHFLLLSLTVALLLTRKSNMHLLW